MNQPLNYEIDGTQYYYELDTSKWYTINKDNTISYINRWYDNMSYVYDTMTYRPITMTLCHIPNKLTLIENR